MHVTKYGHSCVDVSVPGGRIIIDPGAFTPTWPVAEATAILITHQHFDHVVPERLAADLRDRPGLPVFAPAAVADMLSESGLAAGSVRPVTAGDSFRVAGMEIVVFGEDHATIHEDIPTVANVGFLMDGRVFHPGDAWTVPPVSAYRDGRLDLLLAPIHAPWARAGLTIDWIRRIHPRHVLAIHDGLLNDEGLDLMGRLLGERGPGTGATYRRLEPGQGLDVG